MQTYWGKTTQKIWGCSGGYFANSTFDGIYLEIETQKSGTTKKKSTSKYKQINNPQDKIVTTKIRQGHGSSGLRS